MKACGFKYLALDIFNADDTILFDLNLQDPGPELAGQFDLVTNFGTTEHVINQYRSFKTAHELARPGGLIYHDLPFSGYHNHGYFCYNPIFFRHLAEANGYRVVMQHYSMTTVPTPTPDFMLENGYPDKGYRDGGIEFVLQKMSAAPFRMPLETSTSLDVNTEMWGDENPYLICGGRFDDKNAPCGSTAVRTGEEDRRARQQELLTHYKRSDIQKELIRRYKMKLAGLLGIK
jgi:hypothetical protein